MLIYIHTYMQLDRKVQEWLRTTAAGPVLGWLLVANRLVKRWPRNTTAAPVRQWLRISAARTVLDRCCELQPLGWRDNGRDQPRLNQCSNGCELSRLVRRGNECELQP